jgi:hypothetical protein
MEALKEIVADPAVTSLEFLRCTGDALLEGAMFRIPGDHWSGQSFDS